jgi:hypothetical protein
VREVVVNQISMKENRADEMLNPPQLLNSFTLIKHSNWNVAILKPKQTCYKLGDEMIPQTFGWRWREEKQKGQEIRTGQNQDILKT